MSTTLFDRLRARFRRRPVTAAAVAAGPATDLPPAVDRIVIDQHALLASEYPLEFPAADAATTSVLAAVAGIDLEGLAAQSPSLKGYDWTGYLRCSRSRVDRVQRALRQHTPAGGRVLDFGSYFGNFSLALSAMGFRVDAVDSYLRYGDALAGAVALQQSSGISVHDFAAVGHDLHGLGRGEYDAVLCGGVIEHIAHTPRLLLETVSSMLKPGGVLVLDTPNLGYLYKRLALLEGRSIFPPITDQYFTEIPFEGHHREYIPSELEWMLRAVGHEVLSVETFNYSVFGLTEVTGDDAAYFRQMDADPALREVIMTVSRKPNA